MAAARRQGGPLTLVFAHRGAGPNGPERENTVPAFLAAAALGADGVELDLRRAAGASLVVHHDPVLDDGREIWRLAPGELPSEVPSFGEALEACAGLVVNVEVKNLPGEPDFDPGEGVARAAAAACRRAGSPVVFSSFSLACLAALRRADAGAELGWLTVPADPAEAVATARRLGLGALHPFEACVDAALVEAAHGAGLGLRAWTVDDPTRLSELGRLGVDAVITNEVSLARRALGRGPVG